MLLSHEYYNSWTPFRGVVMEIDSYKVIDHDLEDLVFKNDRMMSETPVPTCPGDMLMHIYISRMFLSMNEV